jgi:hypothetical protein
MAYFKDLSNCEYWEHWEKKPLAVGWLDSYHEFTKGPVDPEFFATLHEMLRKPWQPAMCLGMHSCEFCSFSSGPCTITFNGTKVIVGEKNLFLPYESKIYVAPSLIAHYIESHNYQPPLDFQKAVLAGTVFSTRQDFEAAVKALGYDFGPPKS